MTYRQEIRDLDSTATPAPWVSEGELYGIRENGALLPLGFAPHRPLDSRLIAVYRSAVLDLLDALDAVARLALRAIADESTPAAVGIRQVLNMLDASSGDTSSFRSVLADLNSKTTPPLWDPGHLFLGMGFGPELESLGIATPKVGDAPLIAVSRVAVPRALDLLGFVEQTVVQFGLPDGRLRASGAEAIVNALAEFDACRADEGSGIGTV